MKKRYLILISLTTMLLGTAIHGVVRYQRMHRPFIERIVGRMSRDLDLTDAQRAQIKAIMESERSSVAPLLNEAARNRQAIRESTAGGRFDETQVRNLASRQAQSMTEMIVSRERVKARIYNEVLTPEQRAKADQLFAGVDGFRFGFPRRDAIVPFVP
jgi:Spy/CpxP family protein refolding chaperone